MNLFDIIEKVNNGYNKDPLFLPDGTIVSSDAALKEELEILLPLSVINDGWAAVIGYLCNVREENIQNEKKAIMSLMSGMYEHKENKNLFFNSDGSILCTDCELVRGLIKRVPKKVLAAGHSEVAMFLVKRNSKQNELYRWIILERGTATMEAAG